MDGKSKKKNLKNRHLGKVSVMHGSGNIRWETPKKKKGRKHSRKKLE